MWAARASPSPVLGVRDRSGSSSLGTTGPVQHGADDLVAAAWEGGKWCIKQSGQEYLNFRGGVSRGASGATVECHHPGDHQGFGFLLSGCRCMPCRRVPWSLSPSGDGVARGRNPTTRIPCRPSAVGTKDEGQGWTLPGLPCQPSRTNPPHLRRLTVDQNPRNVQIGGT